MALALVPPAPKPPDKREALRRHASAELLECPRCAGREFIEARTGVQLKRGKASAGTRTLLCAVCLLRGERVSVI